MGTPTAVTYADIVLSYLEKSCLALNPRYYKRYIDDLFIICSSTIQDTIIDTFNQQCVSLQLDAITKSNSGIFLDLTVTIAALNFETKVYQKSINNYMYIPPNSAHNPTIFTNLVISELNRYRLYCSEDSDFNNMVTLFRQRLLARGYIPSFLDPLFSILPVRQTLLSKILSKPPRSAVPASTPLIFIAALPSNKLKPPWKQLLALTDNISNCPRFSLVYPTKRIITGTRNPYSAAFYLTQNRNLINVADTPVKGHKRTLFNDTNSPYRSINKTHRTSTRISKKRIHDTIPTNNTIKRTRIF
jgi:hypothetical protein